MFDYTSGNNSIILATSQATSLSSSSQIIASTSGGVQRISLSNIDISLFDNDAGYLTSSSTQSKYLRSDTADTAAGNITFSDDVKAKFGTGGDLEIYHNGTDSYIDDAGTGDLRIRSNS